MEAVLNFIIPFVNSLLGGFGFKLSPSNAQAIIIIVGVFLLALTFGLARHHMLTWGMKGAHFGIIFGIILTLVVEAALIVGGRTVLVEALKQDSMPKFVKEVVQSSITELSKSLEIEIPILSARDERSAAAVVSQFESLPPELQTQARFAICEP